MPVVDFSSENALGNYTSNTLSRWPDGRISSERLEGVAKVSLNPSFKFSKQDKILTIGSCFAREIEKYLSALGYDVPATALWIPPEERVSKTANDLLNKYSVHSMENELRWAFNTCDVEPERFHLQAGDDKWVDPQLVPNLVPVSLSRVIERRQMVTDLYRRLPECRVVVITLGLGEAWFDTATGLYLNGIPPRAAFAAEPERFRLHVLQYGEIVESLERIHALLSEHGHPDVRMLLTVSPVPFKATFTGKDAIIANCYSKSVQRAAAEEFVSRHDNVDYFPSYEIVTHSNRELAYSTDNIHVTAQAVSYIMNTVMSAYVTDFVAKDVKLRTEPPKLPSLEVLVKQGNAALQEKDFIRAIDRYSSVLGRFESNMSMEEKARIRLYLGIALLRGKYTEEGVHQLEIARSLNDADARTTYKLGLGYARVGHHDRALEMFRRAVELDRSVPDHHWRLGMQLIRMQQPEEAVGHLRDCLNVNPTHVEAIKALGQLGASEKENAA